MNKVSKSIRCLYLSVVCFVPAYCQIINNSRSETIKILREKYPGLYFYDNLENYNHVRNLEINDLKKAYGKKFVKFYLNSINNNLLKDTNNIENKVLIENLSYLIVLSQVKIKHKLYGKGYFVELAYDAGSHPYQPHVFLFVFRKKILKIECCRINKYTNCFFDDVRGVHHFIEENGKNIKGNYIEIMFESILREIYELSPRSYLKNE